MSLDNKKTATIIFGLAVFLLGLDRFLKSVALNYEGEYSLFGNLLKFNFVKNYFIAFSLPLGGGILVAIIVAIVIFLLIYAIRLIKDKKYLEFSLIISVIFGALSNLFDRLRYGYVIDYLDLKYFTIFNIADAMIVMSICGIFVIQLINDKKKNIDLEENI